MHLRLRRGPLVMFEGQRAVGRDGIMDVTDGVPRSCGSIFAGHWKLLKFLKQIDGEEFAFYFFMHFIILENLLFLS